VWAVSLALLAGSSEAAEKGKPATCKDVSLAVTIVSATVMSGTNGTLSMDKPAPYSDDIEGVFSTVIHFCGAGKPTPTYDATVGLNGSTRSTTFTFPPAIIGSIIPPGSSPVWLRKRH